MLYCLFLSLNHDDYLVVSHSNSAKVDRTL